MVLAAGRPVRFLAKNTLFRIPVFGWVLRAYKETPIDRSSPRKVKESIALLMEYQKQTPRSLLIFPEGTRGDGTDILPFKTGSGKILTQLGLPVVPFSIRGSLAAHEARSIRVHPAPVRIIFGIPISAEEVRSSDPAELIARVEQAVSQQYHLGLSGGEKAVQCQEVGTEN
jgi:1-acyl-sn-glycerol-3-phosphate acyltransferase